MVCGKSLRHSENPYQTKNLSEINLRGFCGMDGTRTRDLLRDRQAF
jgi:hypothetical protein